MIFFLKKHWGTFVLAGLFALLIGLPAFYFRYFSGDYRGIDFLRADADWAYLSQVQEIHDGHPTFGNLYGAEHKDSPNFAQQTLGPRILNAPTRVFPAKPVDVVLFSKFIIGFIFTWIVYLFFYVLLDRKRLEALVATSFTIFIPVTTTLLDPFQWWSVLRGFSTSKLNFLAMQRTINPQFGSLAVYLFFGLLCRFLWGGESKKRLWWGVGAGIALGLSFYTYFFAYSFVALFALFLTLWFLCRRQWQQVVKMVWVGGTALIVAMPFFFNLYSVLHSAYYLSVMARLGGVLDYRFVFSRIILLAIVCWFLFRKRFATPVQVFFGVFLTTAFFVTEQQVLTGHVIPQYSHYHWYYVAPMLGTFLCLIVLSYLRSMPRRVYIGAGMVLLTLLLWSATIFQWRSYEAQRPTVLSYQRYGDLLSWLNQETPKDSVLLANEDLSELTVAYTHNNVYAISNFADSLIMFDRLESAVFMLASVQGIKSDTAAVWFQKNREVVGAALYGQYYRQGGGGCYGCFSEDVMAKIVKDYQAFIAQDSVKRLTTYQLDYLVWDSLVDPLWSIDPQMGNPVYDKDGIKIYRTHP